MAEGGLAPADLRELTELLGQVVADAQSRLAERALQAADRGAKIARGTVRRPQPFVDLTPYAGMTDRQVARALGVHPDDVSLELRAIRDERTGVNDLRLQGKPRCEAGRLNDHGLRCPQPAREGERWCNRHHPTPLKRSDAPAAAEAARVSRERLWQRPDGRVLEGLYTLTDAVDALIAEAAEQRERATRLQTAAAQRDLKVWLDADEAAVYTRRARSAVRRAAAAGELSGVRESPRGAWAFRPADLDAWLEAGKGGSGKYRYHVPEPPARRRAPRG